MLSSEKPLLEIYATSSTFESQTRDLLFDIEVTRSELIQYASIQRGSHGQETFIINKYSPPSSIPISTVSNRVGPSLCKYIRWDIIDEGLSRHGFHTSESRDEIFDVIADYIRKVAMEHRQKGCQGQGRRESMTVDLCFVSTLPYDPLLMKKDEVSSCAVCLEEFGLESSTDREAKVVFSYCNHEFHKCCVENWLNTKGTCPLCRCRRPVVAYKLQSGPS